jgi:hypothetical protein
VTGDYLFRDNAGFGTTSGVWGIMRVQPAGVAPVGAPLSLQGAALDGASVQALGLEP